MKWKSHHISIHWTSSSNQVSYINIRSRIRPLLFLNKGIQHSVKKITNKKTIWKNKNKTNQNNASVISRKYWVKCLHSSILHYVFSSWIEKTMTKTINCHWKNRFVLQWYGAVRKFYQILYSLNYLTHIMSSYQENSLTRNPSVHIFIFVYSLFFFVYGKLEWMVSYKQTQAHILSTKNANKLKQKGVTDCNSYK